MKETFTKLVQTRQSCRDFNDLPLEASVVQEIAKQAMLAPSACNSQPWTMYVVTSPERLEKTAVALGVKHIINSSAEVKIQFVQCGVHLGGLRGEEIRHSRRCFE